MPEIVTVRDVTLALAETNRGIYLAPERRKLASGRMSCFYLNVGDEVISYPSVKDTIVKALAQTFHEATQEHGFQPDKIVGVPEGGNMLTSSLGDTLSIGQLRIREIHSDHGDQRSIEGDYFIREYVGVIEDVMSTGGSTLTRAVEPLRGAELNPIIAVSLVDRQYGGITNLRAAGLTTKAFTTTTEIAEVLIAENMLSDAQIRLLQEELEELKALNQ